MKLARYASEDVNTDKKKQDRFRKGLSSHLKAQLITHIYPDFNTLMNRTILHEDARSHIETERKRKFLARPNQQERFQRYRTNSFPRPGNTQRPETSQRPVYQQTMQYRVLGSNTQASTPTYPSQNNASQTRSMGTKAPVTERTCFQCRSPGHMIANCLLRNPMQAPTNPIPRPAVFGASHVESQGSVQPRRTNQSFGRGRVNHVIAQDAEETP